MRTLTAAAPLLGLTLILAACSSSGGATTAPSAAPASEAPASEAASEAASESAAASEAPSESAAAGGPAVNLADTSLGSVLVDSAGKTLYIFTPDAAAAGKSVCNDKCAAAWPPLLGDAATPGTGLDAEDFTTITRDDGATQIAFYGMPLYSFAADAAAGDVKGQGLNDKWYVVGADGTPIK